MRTAVAPHPKVRTLPEDFERIFRENHAFVFRTAHRVTGSIPDAEDVVQTLFLRLLRRGFPADLEGNPRKYLYRAAVNIALDVLRSRQRHPIADEPAEALELVESRSASPGEEDVEARLRVALTKLRPKTAEILILRYVHGYTDAEIAKLLGTSRGTIAVSLFRARKQLRKSIRGYMEKK